MVPVQLFPASIKNYLVATMACLCIPGVGALTYMAGQSLGDVRTNMRLTDLVEADRALLLAGNLIRSNRGQRTENHDSVFGDVLRWAFCVNELDS